MRTNSKKQTVASQLNGAKSVGPKSASGKQKSSENALKQGLFSTAIVVEAAGERVEDYKSLQAAVWEWCWPENVVQEILANDVVVNCWRRERVRRCEAAAVVSRVSDHVANSTFLHSNPVEQLTFKFCNALEQYNEHRKRNPGVICPNQIVIELENMRRALMATSFGVKFLINKVHVVKNDVKATGVLSSESEAMLRACVGSTNIFALYFRVLDYLIKKESANSGQAPEPCDSEETNADQETTEKPQSDLEPEAEQEIKPRKLLILTIKTIESQLRMRQNLLEAVEKEQRDSRFAAVGLPEDSSGDRFTRAETAYDRRMYRALAALVTIKNEVPPKIPVARKCKITKRTRGPR